MYGSVEVVNGFSTGTKNNCTYTHTVWWNILYRIDGSSLGRNKTLAADSCKQIKEHDCNIVNPKSGVYWIWKKQPMQVATLCMYAQNYLFVITYFRFTVIWTLMEEGGHLYGNIHTLKHHLSQLICTTPYFSDYYRHCTTYSSGWCNIPDKNALTQLNKW